MRIMSRLSRLLKYLIVCVAWMGSTALWAQSYPSKPVRYIVPFGAGATHDMVARLLADRLTRLWGQQVIVDNRVGAAGVIGAAFVAKSPPDGYTLLQCNMASNAIAVGLYEKLPFDQERDFAPITRIGSTPNIITIHPSIPFKSLKEFIAYARANPGKLSYASGVAGNSTHLAMEWLKLRTKIDVVHIPYKAAPQGISDTIGGFVPANVATVPQMIGFINDGRLRGLAITSVHRVSQLPNVPTVQESGVPDFELTTWYGVCAPAGTPAPLLDKLNADITAVLRSPDVKKLLDDMVASPSPTTRQEFDQFIRSEVTRWARVIKDAKIPKE
jgi:tripartite-type tricarboxylate transporter receptor subunit TctC